MSIFKSNENTGISKKAIAEIAALAALACDGVAGLSAGTIKEGITSMLRKESSSKGVDVTIPKTGGVGVTLHIITEYGTDIKVTGNNVCAEVRKVLESSGIETQSVRAIVEGIRHQSLPEEYVPPQKEEDIILLEGDELLEKVNESFEHTGVITSEDGKYMASSEGIMLASDEDVLKCASKLVEIIAEDTNIAVIAVYYGKNADKKTAEAILKQFTDEDSDIDTEIHSAENMKYDFIIGVE